MWVGNSVPLLMGDVCHSCTSSFISLFVQVRTNSFFTAPSLSPAKGMACFHSSLEVPGGRFLACSEPVPLSLYV